MEYLQNDIYTNFFNSYIWAVVKNWMNKNELSWKYYDYCTILWTNNSFLKGQIMLLYCQQRSNLIYLAKLFCKLLKFHISGESFLSNRYLLTFAELKLRWATLCDFFFGYDSIETWSFVPYRFDFW